VRRRFPQTLSLSLFALLLAVRGAAAEPAAFDLLTNEFSGQVRPLLARFCLECHSTETHEGELDLERFAKFDDVRSSVKIWLKVAEMLDGGEMPPKEAKSPTSGEKKQLRAWIERYLNAEASASAGDPGPVVLRRLSNAQYTYTVQDLTGVDLNPLREFPTDSAAGEGFTNTGSALVMSPSLLTKYLDAGKAIALHAVLLPDGFRFSPSTTPRDWTDDVLARIRNTYLENSDPEAATKINLQGITWETSEAGRLPVEKYLAATLAERESLATGRKSVEAVAAERRLNARYLKSLWSMLNGTDQSQLLDVVRARWRTGKPAEAAAIAAEIAEWQKALTRFQSVGHMKPWMVPVNPVTSRQEIRLKLTPPQSGNEVTVYLVAGEAGDGPASDCIVWQQPRLVAPGRPDLLLRDVRNFTHEMTDRRKRVFASTAKSLPAVDEASRATDRVDVAELAKKHGVDAESLSAWLGYFGVNSGANLKLDYFTKRIDKTADYAFVKGWGTPETPSLMANSSDQHVRIPGNMKPHGVVVHPSPTLCAAIGWRSPIAGIARIEGQVTHAHPECGNGVTWSLELRRGNTRQVLGSGTAAGNAIGTIGPIERQMLRAGDLVSIVVGPRDGNHACDLTDIELTISSPIGDGQTWSLTRDVSDDVLSANPHSDRFGNDGVWHFYTEPVGGNDRPTLPGGSLLARWQSEDRAEEKRKLANEVQMLLVGGPPGDSRHPDALLYRQLASVGGPLLANARRDSSTSAAASVHESGRADADAWGLDPIIFGRHPNGSAIDAANLCVQAPSIVEVRLPADLAVDCELVATVFLDPQTATEGSVQPMVVREKPASLAALRPDAPVLTGDNSAARRRFANAFDDFRNWFPAALCYIRIVPVDEVVTLTLFHREDGPLCRLMLDDEQRANLDRLWDELHFVSHDALTLVDAFAQLMEFATQDSDPRLFEPYRKPIHERAGAFRRALVDAEPRQVDALVDFAARAYRRPLTDSQAAELRRLYSKLREQELPHDEAFRFTLARIFVSPEFLYRLEKAAPGTEPGPVSDWELANRLSYFLWSSIGDPQLQAAAAAGRLRDADMLASAARRMLGDPRVRRLAEEFACQWLHIYDFRTLDEKNEKHFPTFLPLRDDMQEEAVRFFTDLFQRDASVLGIFNADHAFLNEALANHYDIPGVTGPQWRRVDGVGQYGRGGILGLSATLAKQSGASRTSPILRGNWVSEVLLGEKLPRPPKDVPRLPEDETATEGLTVRQLVEKHSSDPLCAKCHVRMDPLGYALEGYDAIGRHREKDLGGRTIDTRARLPDGAGFQGMQGLRDYLLNTRRDAVLRQFNRKLLGFALGRSVQLSDEPLLHEMQRQLEKNEYRFSAAVEAIVRSRQFREIRGREAQFAEGP
jgi:hypothetical protein